MMTFKMMSKAFLVGTGLFFAAHTAHADPADLDTTFSTDGKVVSAFGTGGGDTAWAVKVQSDGKIVTAGTYGGNWAIARHTAAGVLDTTFNNDGKVTTNYGGTDGAFGLDFQSDGKIVAVGYGQGGSLFCITRYLTNGTHDTTFNSTGKVGYNFGYDGATAYAVTVLSTGKILVAGHASNSDNLGDFVVARLNSDGSLDTTFSGDGWAIADFGGDDIPMGMAVQSDGKIVLAGTTYSGTTVDFAVARFTSSGALDTTFSSDGMTTIDMGGYDQGYGVAVQSDGKIVVAGKYSATPGASRDFAAARLTSAGALDTSFSGDGKVITDFGGDDYAYGLALQSDGKIILSGDTPGTSPGGGTDFALLRYTTAGALDTTFSGDGKVTTDFSSNSFDHSHAVTVQSDGKIIAAGDSGADGAGFGLARYVGTPVSPIIAPKTPKSTSTSTSSSAQSS